MTFDGEFDEYARRLRELLQQQKDAIGSGDTAKAMALGEEIINHINEADVSRKLMERMNKIAKQRFGKSFDEMIEEKPKN